MNAHTLAAAELTEAQQLAFAAERAAVDAECLYYSQDGDRELLRRHAEISAALARNQSAASAQADTTDRPAALERLA